MDVNLSFATELEQAVYGCEFELYYRLMNKQVKGLSLKADKLAVAERLNIGLDGETRNSIVRMETSVDIQRTIIQLVENSKDIIYYYEVQPEFKFRYISPSLDNYLGEGVVKSSYNNPFECFERIHPDDYEILYKKVHGDIDFNKPIIQRWKNNEQVYLTFEEYATPVYNEKGELIAVGGIIRNIDDKVKLEQDLEYRVTHDTLTGVYNREFYDRVVQKYGRKINTSIGIILCDLDELKYINDNFGHKQGDTLIRETAQILNHCSDDNVIVTRIGGDEFAVLITGVNQADVEGTLMKISKEVLNYNERSTDIQIKMSKGYAFSEHSIGAIERLFFEADSSMYMDKNSKKHRHTIR